MIAAQLVAFCRVFAPDGKPEADHAIVGQVGQPDRGREGFFECLDMFGEEGFADAGGENGAVGDEWQPEAGADAGNDLIGHHPFHLMRNARHGDKDAAFFFEPHTRGGAAAIGDDRAGIRYFGLLEVAVDHRALQPGKDLFYVVKCAFVDDELCRRNSRTGRAW